MAKKDKGDGGEEAPKKKKPIVPIVLVVVGLFAGKTFFGGGSETTPEQMKAELKAAEEALVAKCASWNGGGSAETAGEGSDTTETTEGDTETTTGESEGAASDGSYTVQLISTRGATLRLAAEAAADTETTTEKVKPGPVIEQSSTTINLADGRYLKVGMALQMPEGADAKLAKEEGLGARAVDIAISHLQTKTMRELLPPSARTEMKHAIGNEVCMAYEGEFLTVYFTEFVMQ